MNNFTLYNPVKIHFGRGQIEKLSDELKAYKKSCLPMELAV